MSIPRIPKVVNDVRDRAPTTARWLRTRSLGALVALSALGMAGCTSEAAAPSAPAAVTPTVTAQFVSPSALLGSPSSILESTAIPTASPSPAATTSAEATPTSALVSPAPQSSTPLGSVLPEVLNPTDPKEIADRQAVEAAWVRFWDYYPTFEELSPQERETIADSISVDPLKTQILDGAANADANGRTGYGTVTHRISWFQNVAAGSNTVIADCMDQSLMGSADRVTGKKLSHGFEREDIRGELVFDQSAGWRVRNIFYIQDAPPC